jgi:hypothetical protein
LQAHLWLLQTLSPWTWVFHSDLQLGVSVHCSHPENKMLAVVSQTHQ